MSKPLLTYERAIEVLVYDPETGALNWRVSRPGAPLGALVGTRTADGYTQVEIDYRLYRAHRVIWLMQTGRWPAHQVDHRNGLRADNRWRNLREATNLQNSRNRRPGATNTSGRIGVTYLKAARKWQAFIGVHNKTIVLGSFETFEVAVAARIDAELRHYGEFAAKASQNEEAA